MKKVIPCIFLIIILLSGCGNSAMPYGESTQLFDFSDSHILGDTTSEGYGLLSCDNNSGERETDSSSKTPEGLPVSGENYGGEIRGVWLSYYEIDVDSSRNTAEKYTAYIESLCGIFRQYGITDAFVQVRPYADALYKSGVYPTSAYAGVAQGEAPPFDQLQIICEVMSRYFIRVHAWVNPYRVHNGTDINELSLNNKARQWYNEKSSEDVVIVGGKIYFNPSSAKAQALVLEGAREILESYPVAGIHIDDYFYPPDCGSFDAAQYSTYLSQGGKESLERWRTENVNTLVKALYRTVKDYGQNKIFSISPAGNINNNRTSLYADVALWCKGGYADMIIPQIYFGFEHESHGFEGCMADWYSLKGDGVKMPVGLALYKSGTEDSFAGAGKAEWLQSTDIITRQVKHIRKTGGDGFAIFSTEFFLHDSGSAKKELDSLKQYLNDE